MTPRILGRGENTPLSTDRLTVAIGTATGGGPALDVVAFVLGPDRRVRDDADFVFYNNPRSTGAEVTLTGPATLDIDLTRVADGIERIAIGVSVDAPATLGESTIETTLTAGADTIVAPAQGLRSERAAVLIEIYRRNAQWKVRSESAGWNAGFASLVREHGVTVDDTPTSQTPTPDAPISRTPVSAAPTAPGSTPGIRMVKGEEKLSLEKRQKLNLRKEQVHRVLLTKGAAGATARVVLVIDKTMSMRKLYKKQTVHRVVERMIPVATQLDSDGNLEAYLYGSGYAKLPDVTVADSEIWMDTYIHLTGRHGAPLGPEIDYDRQIGGVNEELPIMNAILDDAGGGEPVLVLFFTDGGFHSKVPAIRSLIHTASSRPVFWQFIGLGRNRFGILTELDTLAGRVVDNAGFFAIDDVDAMSDADLYEQLLTEFPEWLREAVRHSIVDARYVPR
ncbi:VWA domain-containing protein [Gordonia polyisoprenivorans]|uniref:VWA domain-containing protein n=1 Tax=Gordonia polyisoprenivorans TaxID=84595 RepID=UPI001AD78A48|nr:VWA domain-containing protein [Gordonia polyisoprenivorans]QTI67305.1 VWA domain-containing protein [Gordonia polyisoprenivorans]